MTPLAQAQQGNRARQQDERNENERVAKAEQRFSEAKRDLASVQKELRAESARLEKSAQSLQQLRRKWRDAQEEVEDHLGAKLGIPDALVKVRKAGAELEGIAIQVRARVHDGPDWKLAKEDAEKAKEARAAMLEDLEQIDTDDNSQMKELVRRIGKPLELEEGAIAKDPRAIEASKRLAIQQEALEALRKRLPVGEVDKDRKVVQALSNVVREEKSHLEIQRKMGKVKTEAIQVQKRYAESQMNLQKAKAADAADSNRPGKSKGK